MATELKTPEWSEPQLRQRLGPHLRQLRGPATLGDIVAGTGLPAERTEPVLRELLDAYDGRLQVDERGELLYTFPHGLRREETWRDTWQKVKATLWTWFKLAYKAAISVILVVYFVLFFVIMVVVVIGALVAANSSDSDFDFDGCGCSPFDLLLLTDPSPSYATAGDFGRRGMTPYRPKAKGAGERLPFWLRVFEFVFGEEQQRADPAEDELRLVSYLRDHSGRATVADIVALTGQSTEEAERTLLHLMVEHGGDVEVSDDGTLSYTFDRLMSSAAKAGAPRKQRQWTWWWERPEQPRRLSRNTPAWNWGIGLLNAFNLAWSSYFAFTPLLPHNWLWLVLGPVPLVYSLLFYLIPLVRAQKLNAENAAREWRNRLREVARKVFGRHVVNPDAGPISADEMLAYQREPGDLVHTAGNLNSLLSELAGRWDGEVETEPDGRRGYRFRALQEAWRDGTLARQAVDPAQWSLGRVVYDTEDEHAELEDEWRQRMTGEPGDDQS